MADTLIDPVPLGAVFQHKDGPTPEQQPLVNWLIARINQEYLDGTLAIWGRPPGEVKRVRIWPADDDIYWAGERSRRPDIYCEVFSRPHIDEGGPWLKFYDEGKRSDLAISKSDWTRLCIAAHSRPSASCKGRPGPKPRIRQNLVSKMLADLESRRRTVSELSGDTLEALVTAYPGGSLNTAAAARKDAIKRFQSSNSENH